MSYLLYHEKSFGMLALAFLRWSSCTKTSSNFSMDLKQGIKWNKGSEIEADYMKSSNQQYAR